MTNPEPFATRREFDLLAQRVENMDREGTRGVVAVQAQLTDAIRDLGDLKLTMGKLESEVDAKFRAHAQQHERDQRDRVSGRRWFAGAAIAGLGSFATVIGLLVEVLQHLH